jgi:hypothetical protein
MAPPSCVMWVAAVAAIGGRIEVKKGAPHRWQFVLRESLVKGRVGHAAQGQTRRKTFRGF